MFVCVCRCVCGCVCLQILPTLVRPFLAHANWKQNQLSTTNKLSTVRQQIAKRGYLKKSSIFLCSEHKTKQTEWFFIFSFNIRRFYLKGFTFLHFEGTKSSFTIKIINCESSTKFTYCFGMFVLPIKDKFDHQWVWLRIWNLKSTYFVYEIRKIRGEKSTKQTNWLT